jgi:Uma2 family endonuclease
MTSEPKRHLTVEEYLTLERQSETRNEYWDGEIVAMTGASLRHNRISLNVATALHNQLRDSGCTVLAHDMRLRIRAANVFTYPDVVVYCGEPQLDDAAMDTLLNPVLIVEVLSKSTEDYDRGKKFVYYRALPSLVEYVLVAQDRPHVEHFTRQPAPPGAEAPEGMRWLLTETDRIEAELTLNSIGCRLALADVYKGVSAGAPAARE